MGEIRKDRSRKRSRGEGTIESTASGKYRAVIRLNPPVNGETRARSPSFATKKEAVDWLANFINSKDKFTGSRAKKVTVKEWLNRWIANKIDPLKSATISWYQQRADKHIIPRIGNIVLSALTKEVVEDWLSKMRDDKVTPGERWNSLRTLSYSLSAAVDDGIIPRNPCKKIKRPKDARKSGEREMTCLTEEEVKNLLAANEKSKHRLRVFFPLAIDSGCRPNELLGLHWPEVDLDAGTIRIRWTVYNDKKSGEPELVEPKTKKSRRVIMLAPSTVDGLRDHRERMKKEGRDIETGLVFPNRFGSIIRLYVFWQTWKRLRKDSGLSESVRLYDLRHTMATLLLGKGVNLRVIADRLGHETVEITLRFYAHAMPDQQEAARVAMAGILAPKTE